MFAHFAQETGNHNPSDKEYEEWRQVRDFIRNDNIFGAFLGWRQYHIWQHFWHQIWTQGLSSVREQGCTDTSPGCGYNSNCEDTDSITKKWACGEDRFLNNSEIVSFYQLSLQAGQVQEVLRPRSEAAELQLQLRAVQPGHVRRGPALVGLPWLRGGHLVGLSSSASLNIYCIKSEWK